MLLMQVSCEKDTASKPSNDTLLSQTLPLGKYITNSETDLLTSALFISEKNCT
jgi:hypothetical protein